MPVRTITDWLNRNYYIRRVKNWRNTQIDLNFRQRGLEDAKAFVEYFSKEPVDTLCVTIAYNVPAAIDLLTASWSQWVPGATLVVVDNSSSPDARIVNRQICDERNQPYLSLPKNIEWSPNRSHGISMNWAYYNIIHPLRPVRFGFIDHDCFPFAPFDFAQKMKGLDVYGVCQNSMYLPQVWNLWAGFCFYRYAAVCDRAIDFKHRIELGLDTGGGNWLSLYRQLSNERAKYTEISTNHSDFPGRQVIDRSFVHLGSASYRHDRDSVIRFIQDFRNCHLGGTPGGFTSNV